MKKTKLKRLAPRLRPVYPPQPVLLANQNFPANQVLSVQLAPEEKVQWIWSITPDGIRYVSGYEIFE